MFNNAYKNTLLQAISKYKNHEIYFELPVSVFGKIDEPQYYPWLGWQIVQCLDEDSSKWEWYIAHEQEVIAFYHKGAGMNASFTIVIPYLTRNKYINFVYEINKLVSVNGQVALFVNNTPSHAKSYLVVESNINIEEIKKLINEYELSLNYEVGFSELFRDAYQYKLYNMVQMQTGADLSYINEAFSFAYLYADNETLEKRGIYNKPTKKIKAFISYCHKNKKVVYEIVESMKLQGVNCWIDTQDIDVGDNILNEVLNGIKESDLAMLFISKATLKSNFTQLELITVMSEMMKKQMGWFLVKLDDVKPDDILPSLSDYKYYDFSINTNIEELIDSVKNKIKKITRLNTD